MSKQPAPKNNLMTVLLLGAMIFMGLQLFLGPKNAQQQDKRTHADVWAEMQKLNHELKDVSIQKELRTYESKVNAANDLTPAEKERQVLRGYLLTADTMHKSGLYWHRAFKEGNASEDWGYRKLDRAYQLLKPKFEKYIRTPIWTDVHVEVEPTQEVPGVDPSAKDVYNTIVTDLSPLAKAEPVFGFIPGYQLIDVLVQLTGAVPGFSYWFAALLLAVVVRGAVWPLAQRQIMYGRQMQKLQPRIKEIQAKYQDGKTKQIKDPAAYQQETMGLYKEYGINPAAGCWPMFVQMPLFLAVYQAMHHYKFEFVKGTFLWINPGSDRFLGIPLAPNLGERDYILVAIYMCSMVASTLLMPISDPTNARQQRLMGVAVAVIASVFMFFYTLPSAFVLYWIFTNVLSTAQSLLSYRLPVPELKKVQSVTGGKVVDTTATNGHANGALPEAVTPEFFASKGGGGRKQRKKKK